MIFYFKFKISAYNWVEKIPYTIIRGFGSKMNKSEQVWAKKKSEINGKTFWLKSCGQLPLQWICNIAQLNLDQRCS